MATRAHCLNRSIAGVKNQSRHGTMPYSQRMQQPVWQLDHLAGDSTGQNNAALQIITFDAQGVSHHPNHIAVWRGAV